MMRAVWKLGKTSVWEIRVEMGGKQTGAYTAVAIMQKFLEKRRPPARTTRTDG